MVRAFQKRSLKRSLSTDKYSIVQWTAYRRVNWNKMLQGQLLVSSYPVHSGIVRKAELFIALMQDVKEHTEITDDSIPYSLREAVLPFYTCETAS